MLDNRDFKREHQTVCFCFLCLVKEISTNLGAWIGREKGEGKSVRVGNKEMVGKKKCGGGARNPEKYVEAI